MNTDKIYAESLANEYAPKETSKVVALKKLDRKAKLPAEIFGYTFGIDGALIAGTGMCLSMQVIGSHSIVGMVAGIVIGLIGFVAMAVNYPIYKKYWKKESRIMLLRLWNWRKISVKADCKQVFGEGE